MLLWAIKRLKVTEKIRLIDQKETLNLNSLNLNSHHVESTWKQLPLGKRTDIEQRYMMIYPRFNADKVDKSTLLHVGEISK